MPILQYSTIFQIQRSPIIWHEGAQKEINQNEHSNTALSFPTNIQYIFFSLSECFFTFHKCYVDGGISDNLPQHFKEGETITVSPFCGEHDICPKDVSSNEAHIELRNTSMQLTSNNLERLTYALFPPDEIVLSNICRQGYRDTLRFLKEHYPETLTKESVRTASVALNLPSADNNLSASCQETNFGCRTSYRSQISSRCFSCSYSEIEVYSGSESETDYDEEDGESQLSLLLVRANEAATEQELWSCFLLRRSFYVLDVFTKPCIITIRQVLAMIKIFLKSLTKLGKTGNRYFDELLSVLTTMFHTYEDNHQVLARQWKSELPITDLSRRADRSLLTLSEWRQKVLDNSKSCKAECHCTSEGSSTSCHEESMADVRCNECKLIMNADDCSDDSFILNTNALPRELQVHCLAETIIMMESHVGDSYKGKKFNNKKDISKNNSPGTITPVGESDGAKSPVVDDCDEYVILDGFK